jgi:Protein of unknown function (DUF3102)
MQHMSENAQEKLNFDYEALPLQKRSVIHQWTIEIKERLRHTALIIWEIGHRLVQVRSQLESRQFCSWLKFEFGWSQRTAYNFINVYKAFPEFANFAKIEISISSLYLLAAPSTPQEIRSQFLDMATAGEKISNKTIQEAIKKAKQKHVDSDKLTPTISSLSLEVPVNVQACQPDKNFFHSQKSVMINPKLDLCRSNLKTSNLEPLVHESEQTASNINTSYLKLCPGWNTIQNDFLLFWGDTASPYFIERLPEEAFILAIPSSQWCHDWVLSKSRNFIILNQLPLKEELIDSLLSEFSQREKAVILPWLPNWKTIQIALKHNIKVYAGDSDLNCCEKVVSQLGLNVLDVIQRCDSSSCH